MDEHDESRSLGTGDTDGVSSHLPVPAEVKLAVDAFYTAMIGRENYKRWMMIKHEQNFTSEARFTSWVLDVVQLHLDTTLNQCVGSVECDTEGHVVDSEHQSVKYEQFDVMIKEQQPQHLSPVDLDGRDTEWNEINSTPPSNSKRETQVKDESSAECNDRLEDDYNVDLTCNICGSMFDSPSNLTRHMTTHFDDICTSQVDSDKANNQFRVDKLVDSLQYEQRCINMNNPACSTLAGISETNSSSGGTGGGNAGPAYLCQFCNKRFTHKCNKWRHEKTVHFKDTLYSCHVCQRTFTQKSSMKRHVINIHTHPHRSLPLASAPYAD